MVQGGGFEPGMRKKDTRPAIRNESPNGLSNVRGAIAMARTSDLNSATSQFYINTVDNAHHLDGARYCAFGQVVDKASLDVLDKIRGVRTSRQSGHDDVPVDDVVILSIRRAD
jgi:cyclophilin family peptidyl-prolyl cis-trans isomerase